MAKKNTVIHIESSHDNVHKVWTDLSVKEIEKIEGVSKANQYSTDFIWVGIDPRYAEHEVLRELKELAKKKAT